MNPLAMETTSYMPENPLQILVNALDPSIMSKAVYLIEIAVVLFMVLIALSVL
jgi:hypothetical protein